MSDLQPVVQKLRQFGLTRTEAEVYVAALQEASGGPVSAYKVAQAMGRDPANLAKNLAALEKHAAVRVVQEKPRLYLPVMPAEFTAALLDRMKDVGRQLVADLERLSGPQSTGLTLSLRDNQQALDQAAELLKGCTSELLIFASRDVIDYLGRDFGELASRGNCRVRYLGVEPSGIALAEDTIIPMPAGFSEDPPLPWLQLIVDRSCWLTAQFNRPESPDFPCGWWSDDPAMARVMAGALDAACDGVPYQFTPPPRVAEEVPPTEAPLVEETVEPEVAPEPEPEPEPQPEPEPDIEPQLEAEPDFESGAREAFTPSDEPQAATLPTPPEPEPKKQAEAAAGESVLDDEDDLEDEDDDGFEFVVRHEEDD
jgi:sugar-specific transcriptional regulator TrmB